MANERRVQSLRDFMLGRVTGVPARLFEAKLREDPQAMVEAQSIGSDTFLNKLRRTVEFRNQENAMTDEISPPRTILESDEEVARVQAELRTSANHDAHNQSSVQEVPYTPTIRNATPILVVCDDGRSTGEEIRIRSDRFVIGRTEGDLQISNDEMVSSRHAAIVIQRVSNKVRLLVTDLQSRNGLFVRVKKAPLAHGAEVLIGAGRYRFEILQALTSETSGYADLPQASTRAFDETYPPGTETLTEIVAGGIGTRIVLQADNYWIGRDADCAIRRADDAFVKGRHARLSRSERGTWVIQNNRTLNGIWLRMPQVIVDEGTPCDFRVGEQRFKLFYGAPR